MTTRDCDSTEQSYRCGIIGFGWLGTELARQIQGHDRAFTVGVADVSADARAKAAKKLDLPESALFEDYLTLFDEAALDAVIVTTPHAFHYEQLNAALDADLDVLCEKPICVDPEHASEIVTRSESADETLMIGYQRHLSAAYRTARSYISDAREITHVDAEITQPYMELFGGTWRTDPSLSGGGVLMDTGNHLLDGLLWTTGLTPIAVSAEMSFEDESRCVDSAATLSVEFESGVIGSIAVSGRAPQFSEHLHVWTEESGINFDEDEVRIVDDGEHRQNIDRNGERNKIEAFVDALDGTAEPPATARDSLRSVALTAAAYESARSGERVSVGSDLDLGPTA